MYRRNTVTVHTCGITIVVPSRRAPSPRPAGPVEYLNLAMLAVAFAGVIAGLLLS
jgi:hypothetical protein